MADAIISALTPAASLNTTDKFELEQGTAPSNSSRYGTIQQLADFLSSLETDRRTVTNVSSSAGIVTLNYALGDYFTLTLTENVTGWSIINPPGSGKGFTLMVQITQGAGPYTMTNPGTFADGGVIAVPTANGDIGVLAITSFDNGTTLRCSSAKDFS